MLNKQHILLDLDDTLIDTQTVFTTYISQAISFLATEFKTPEKTYRENFEQALYQAHQEVFVNPQLLWPLTFSKLGLSSRMTNDALAIVMQIYTTPPPLHSGATELIDFLQQGKKEFALVTHAAQDWTAFKLRKSGLAKYFPAERIILIDINGKKTASGWQRALQATQTSGDDVIVVGDNIKGDIIAAHDAGVPGTNLIWVDREHVWEAYRTGELPTGTQVVTDLHQLLG